MGKTRLAINFTQPLKPDGEATNIAKYALFRGGTFDK